MGQAKLRGTREERVAIAVARKEEQQRMALVREEAAKRRRIIEQREAAAERERRLALFSGATAELELQTEDPEIVKARAERERRARSAYLLAALGISVAATGRH